MSCHLPHKASVFGEILGALIGIYIIRSVLPHLPFVTSAITLWIPLGITVTILDALIKISKHLSPRPLSFFFEALSTLPGMYSTFVLIRLFPFDFSRVNLPDLNSLFYLALNFTLFALGLACFINIVKFFTHIGSQSVKTDRRQSQK